MRKLHAVLQSAAARSIEAAMPRVKEVGGWVGGWAGWGDGGDGEGELSLCWCGSQKEPIGVKKGNPC